MKDQKKTDIFQGQDAPFTPAGNEFSNLGCGVNIQGHVGQEHECDLGGIEAKLLHHEETGEDDKDLTPCAGEKGDGVIEPVTFA